MPTNMKQRAPQSLHNNTLRVAQESVKRLVKHDAADRTPAPKKLRKNSEPKPKPKYRKRVIKAETRRRRTTFFSLPRELRLDISWKVNEYPKIQGTSPKGVKGNYNRAPIGAKNGKFERWIKKMKKVDWVDHKEEMIEDLGYMEKKWVRIHRAVYPDFDDDVILYRNLVTPILRGFGAHEQKKLRDKAWETVKKKKWPEY